MGSIDTIKEKLRNILIEKDGNVQPWDLKDIVAEAKGIGLEENKINKLFREVDGSINWEAIRKHKEEIAKKEEDRIRAAEEQARDTPSAKRVAKLAVPSPRPAPSPLKPLPAETSSTLPRKVVITATLLLVTAAAIVTYLSWLKPHLRDKKAERMYSFADDLSLRSSPLAGVEYNLLKKLRFGDELLVYDRSGDWANVSAEGQEGFVYSQFIINRNDFIELNAIFGDPESRETIATTRCRRALLKYYRDHNIIGKIDPSLISGIDDSIQNKEVWQVFSKGKEVKPNSVIFPKLTNLNSKYSDFGCLITNISTNKRKFLLFSFSDSGEPSLVDEQEAPGTGYISSVKKTVVNDKFIYNVAYTQ